MTVQETPTVVDNKALIERYFDVVVKGRDRDAFSEFIAGSNGDAGAVPGIREWWDFTLQVLDAFPDLEVDVQEMFGEGDWVAVRWKGVGTHRASFLGVPATGKSVPMANFDLFRVEGGQITTVVSHPDAAAILATLGVWEDSPLLQAMRFPGNRGEDPSEVLSPRLHGMVDDD